MHPTSVNTARRRAFTLLEVLLVLAVLVAISAVTLPSIFSVLANRQLVRGGEGVRTAMLQARLQAMRSGRTQMMRFELGGGRFEVAPLASANDVTEAADMIGRGRAAATGGVTVPVAPALPVNSSALNPAGSGSNAGEDPYSALMDDGTLPDQVLFSEAHVQATARSVTSLQSAASLGMAPAAAPAPAAGASGSAAGGQGWSQPILFYPDGTTSNAIVALGREGAGRVLVRIRGLTGIAEVSQVVP